MRPRTQAFTLIELLVVISIIALLIAILLPALGAARNEVRSLACASNQRQLGIAFHVYATDYNGRFPTAMYRDEEWDVSQEGSYTGNRLNGWGPNYWGNNYPTGDNDSPAWNWAMLIWPYAEAIDTYVDPGLGALDRQISDWAGIIVGAGMGADERILHRESDPAPALPLWFGNYRPGIALGSKSNQEFQKDTVFVEATRINMLSCGSGYERGGGADAQNAPGAAWNYPFWIPGQGAAGMDSTTAIGAANRFGIDEGVVRDDVYGGRHSGLSINVLYADGHVQRESVVEIIDAWGSDQWSSPGDSASVIANSHDYYYGHLFQP